MGNDENGNKRKRGLLNSSKIKKSKQEEPQQLQLNEQDNYADIFNQAIELLHTPKGTLLFNAVIHECDAILRSEDGKTDPELISKTNPFHYIYGQALYHVGDSLLLKFQEEQEGMEEGGQLINFVGGKKDQKRDLMIKDVLAHYDAAVERLETGLNIVNLNDTEAVPTYKFLDKISRILIKKAEHLNLLAHPEFITQNVPDDCEKLLNNAIENYDLISTQYQIGERDEAVKDILVSAAATIQSYADNFGDDDWSVREKYNKWAISKFEMFLKENENYKPSLIGIGSAFLSLGLYFVEQCDQQDEDEDAEFVITPEINDYIQKGTMYLNSAWINLTRASIKLDENQQEIITETELDDDDIIILCLLGETYINMGVFATLTNNQLEQKKNYREAVGCFRRVLAVDVDALPSKFQEFLDDFEDNGGDEEEVVEVEEVVKNEGEKEKFLRW